MDGNPWQVASLQDFLYLKCPECTFDTQEEENFEKHALQNHKLSSVFFGEIFVKDEKLNSEEDHKDPLTINGEIRDQSRMTSSEFFSFAPIVPKLSNIKEELIDEFCEKIENNSNTEEPKPNICNKCDKGFTSAKSLKQHFGNVHEEKKFQCDLCSLKFSQKATLKGHVAAVHEGNKPYECSFCNKRFGMKGTLKTHIKLSHEKKKSYKQCNVCAAMFANKHNLNLHITAVHEGGETNNDQIQKCEYCDYTTTRKSCITKHELSTHKELVLKPEVEINYTTTKGPPSRYGTSIAFHHEGYRYHRDRFNGDKSLQFLRCQFSHKKEDKCPGTAILDVQNEFIKPKISHNHDPKDSKNENKQYKCTKYLDQHIKLVQEGSQNKTCSICNKTFTTTLGVKRHIEMVHDKITPFLCTICGYKFTMKRTLENHISAVHEGKKPHVCSHCGKSFGLMKTLKTHIAVVHEGKKSFQCNVCAAMFADKQALNLHITAVHEGKKLYKCPECEKSFGFKCSLTLHLRTVHEGKKAFQCDLCSLKFSQRGTLKGHVAAVHEGNKPYECSFCDKRFGVKGTLKTHIKLSHEKKEKE